MWYGFGEDCLGQKCLQRLGSEGNGENKKVEMCWVYQVFATGSLSRLNLDCSNLFQRLCLLVIDIFFYDFPFSSVRSFLFSCLFLSFLFLSWLSCSIMSLISPCLSSSFVFSLAFLPLKKSFYFLSSRKSIRKRKLEKNKIREKLM